LHVLGKSGELLLSLLRRRRKCVEDLASRQREEIVSF
jgi:hypothetical protein